MCVCKRAWGKESVSSSLSNSSSNRFSLSNDSDNVCTPHQSSLNWFGLLQNSIFPAFCLFFFRYLNPWPPHSFSLHLFLCLLLPLGDGIEKVISLVLHLLKSFHHFNFLQGCFAAIQEKRKRDKRVRGRRKKREGESWGGGELGGLSVVGLRYVCKGLKSVEISRKMPSVAVRGFTPLVVLVQVKRVLRLHKTGQIQPQCQCCGTTMQSAISGP